MGIENVLPTYHRSPTKLPVSFNKLCRSKERVFLTCICVGLVVGCFGTVFFLPDLRTGIALPSINSVYKVYEHVQKVGPESFLQMPPLEKDDRHPDGVGQHHGQIDRPDFHLLEDQARLKAKIEYEEMLEKNQQKVLPRPNIPSLNSDSSTSRYKQLSTLHSDLRTIFMLILHRNVVAPVGSSGEKNVIPPENGHRHGVKLPTVQGGEDSEPNIQQKRETIRQVT